MDKILNTIVRTVHGPPMCGRVGNHKYKETSLTQVEVPCWSYQLGKWMGVKMKEPECQGLVIECAKREQDIMVSEQERS